jgi:hypothetical protein
MRVYSLTLHANNLPEIQKRQSENKAGVRPFRRNGVCSGAAKKRKTCVHFPLNEMRPASGCGAASKNESI